MTTDHIATLEELAKHVGLSQKAAIRAAIALMRGQSEPVELTDNEKIAMQVFGELKGMRGDFTESDPDQLAEFASMCLNTVIHLGLLVERALPAPPKDTADEQ